MRQTLETESAKMSSTIQFAKPRGTITTQILTKTLATKLRKDVLSKYVWICSKSRKAIATRPSYQQIQQKEIKLGNHEQNMYNATWLHNNINSIMNKSLAPAMFHNNQRAQVNNQQPLQQLLGLPWGAPWFDSMPVTKRDQEQRLFWSDQHVPPNYPCRGWVCWGSCCAARHPPMPAMCNCEI